jgi:purine nucleoside permease
MPNRLMHGVLLAALLVAGCFTSVCASERHAHGERRPVKVIIISMFGPEGQVWLDHLRPWRDIVVPGLSPDYPAVHCNRSDVCVVTTGMGHSNAAASMTALVFSHRFDLSRTYFIVAGIGGIDPARGTLGSNFLRPHDGQSSADNLLNYTSEGGFPIALENLYRTGSPLVQQIVDNWRTWRRGVPTADHGLRTAHSGQRRASAPRP